MPRRLIYAPRARDDLDAIRGWLTQFGPGPAAKRRLAAIRTAIERLHQHPCRHPVGEHPGVHELPCAGGYRALYRVTPYRVTPYRVTPDTGRSDTAGDVRILRVFGPGQSRHRT